MHTRRHTIVAALAAAVIALTVSGWIWNGQRASSATDPSVHRSSSGMLRLQQQPELAARTLVAYRPSVLGGTLDPVVVQAIEAVPQRVKFQVNYEQHDDPRYPGHWGSYDIALNTVFLGEKTRGHDDIIQYVIPHETAHAFYFQVLTDAERATVDSTLGVPAGVAPKEGFADCVAKLWGSPALYAYWDCPAEALAYVQSVVDR
jgi:hypothetical protein